MNRREALEQLNQERKQKVNRVWEEWYRTEGKGVPTTERLKKRDLALNQIQDEFEKASLQINQGSFEDGSNKKRAVLVQGLQKRQSRDNASQSTPETDVLPEKNLASDPLQTGRIIRRPKNIDGIRGEDAITTPRESYRAQSTEQDLAQRKRTLAQTAEEDTTQEDLSQNIIQEVKELLTKEGFDPDDFLRHIPGREELDKVLKLAEESKKVSYSFPVFILSLALCVDVLEALPSLIPAIGIFGTWTVMGLKWLIFIPIVYVATVGGENFLTRQLVKRVIIRGIVKRAFVAVTVPLLAFIPYIGALFPETFLMTLFLVNSKTLAGILVKEIAKIAERYV